jgi:hypothetical protein
MSRAADAGAASGGRDPGIVGSGLGTDGELVVIRGDVVEGGGDSWLMLLMMLRELLGGSGR